MAHSQSPGDGQPQTENAETREPDYFDKYLRIGKTSPDDAQFEPELRETLAKLYDRQREQAYSRMQEQSAELSVFGSESEFSVPPKIWKDHREWDKQQNEQFFQERDRYIRQYHAAHSILAEMQNIEKRELQQDLGDDPKLSH